MQLNNQNTIATNTKPSVDENDKTFMGKTFFLAFVIGKSVIFTIFNV